MTNEPSRVADTQGKIEDGSYWFTFNDGDEPEVVGVYGGSIYTRLGIVSAAMLHKRHANAKLLRRIPSPDELERIERFLREIIDDTDDRVSGGLKHGAIQLLATLTTPQDEGK